MQKRTCKFTKLEICIHRYALVWRFTRDMVHRCVQGRRSKGSASIPKEWSRNVSPFAKSPGHQTCENRTSERSYSWLWTRSRWGYASLDFLFHLATTRCRQQYSIDYSRTSLSSAAAPTAPLPSTRNFHSCACVTDEDSALRLRQSHEIIQSVLTDSTICRNLPNPQTRASTRPRPPKSNPSNSSAAHHTPTCATKTRSAPIAQHRRHDIIHATAAGAEKHPPSPNRPVKAARKQTTRHTHSSRRCPHRHYGRTRV